MDLDSAAITGARGRGTVRRGLDPAPRQARRPNTTEHPRGVILVTAFTLYANIVSAVRNPFLDPLLLAGR